MDEADKIKSIKSRLAMLDKEKAALIQTLAELEREENKQPVTLKGMPVRDAPVVTSEEKVSLFLELFSGRKDVFAKRWENRSKGTSGYSPACRNEWVKGVCEKPRVKCTECKQKSFIPLDESSARMHLEGQVTIGTYAILADDSCRFLAVDFDDQNWLQDVVEFQNMAASLGIQVAIERSRSGNGGHAWIFFSEPVPARDARQLGSIILGKTIRERPNMKLESFDRFFPNQDVLPKGGFGNLIALPLQKEARAKGNTEFINPDGTVIEGQWEYLSSCHRLAKNDLNDLLDDYGLGSQKELLPEDEIRTAEISLDQISNGLTGTLSGKTLRVELGPMLRIPVMELPARIISALKRTSVFANPKFFELQRLRFSTWKTPRYISCGEFDGTNLVLPRGCLDKVIEITTTAGGNLSIIDKRTETGLCDIKFTGELTIAQSDAVMELNKHEMGVLVAPPGAGKTVMACALIASRRQKTLVITHRKQLVDQWKSRIDAFLSTKPDGMAIEVKMIQTLARRGVDPDESSKYGFIVVDECHHTPAISFELVMKAFNPKYLLGLTATPFRKDGLHPIIAMQCGPIRYELQSSDKTIGDRVVIFKQTTFKPLTDGTAQEPIHMVWERMVAFQDRNEQIAKDVAEVLVQGRFPLILSDRKDHIDALLECIKQATSGLSVKGFCLIGDMGKKARKQVLEDIKSNLNSRTPIYLIATGSFIGEGFDLPELDTLFLTMPVSFKGRVIQYAGRIHRIAQDKKNVFIYDYLDAKLPLTISMFRKRIAAYRKMGYTFDMNGLEDPGRWLSTRRKRIDP